MRTPILIVKPSKSKTSPWMIDGVRVNGKRKRPLFKTETAAKQELVRIKTKIAREGAEALNLSDSLRVMALQAERTLKPYEKTIAESVAFYVKHLEATKKSITVRALADEYLRSKKATTAQRFTNGICAVDSTDFVRSLGIALFTKSHQLKLE